MSVTLNSASFLNPETLITRLAWARNIVFANLQADASWHLNNSYYLELEIGIYDINTLTFTKLGNSLIEEPNSEGTVIFEIQQKMQDYAGINIPVPDFNATLIVEHTTPTFYIKIFEVVDNVKTQIALSGMSGAVENRYYLVDAIDAALDRETFSYEQQYDWIFGEIENGDRRFLTSVEDPKSTTFYANEFLYWFGSKPNRDLTVDCKIYYDDNTDETVRLFDYMAGYHIQCIPTRYDLIKTKSTQPLKNIIAWSVYAAYNSFLVSQYFRYEIADQPNREAKYFLAKNSFGVFDTLVCQGDYEKFLESESETASKRDFANYAITDAQKFVISKTGKRGGTANTAFLNKLQSVVKQDFTLSREMLLQSDRGFIPIIAEKIKQVYSIKNNNLIGYSFEYAHAHNVTHYTNKIFRPILGEVPTPPTLPKFTVKNTGNAGYVRVEYNAIIVDVDPNSEKSIEIEENVSIKVTWGIVDLDTFLLDGSLVSISYPNYSLPARIDTATFDAVVQGGSTVVAIPDENTVKKARSYTFLMPNNDYFAEIKFRELALLCDYDFENPYCVDNATTTVAKIRDRTQNTSDFVQTTPALRPSYVDGGVRVNNVTKIGGGFSTTYDAKMTYIVGNINRDDTETTRVQIALTLSVPSPPSAYEYSTITLFEASGSNFNKSIATWWEAAGNSFLDPKFALRSSSKKRANWCLFDGIGPSIRSKVIHDNSIIYDGDVGSSGVDINGGFVLGNTTLSTVEATFLRILSINENITAAENTLFLSKIRTKYNIT